MKRCFLIAGPESSGNRLLASILVRGGCQGEGSTNQYKSINDLPLKGDVVWIKHHNIAEINQELISKGFQVTVIILIREWFANSNSIFERGHVPSLEDSHQRILITLCDNFHDIMLFQIPSIVLTYEGINNDSIKKLLQSFNLRTDNLNESLNLLGQEYEDQIYQPNPIQTNLKHYE